MPDVVDVVSSRPESPQELRIFADATGLEIRILPKTSLPIEKRSPALFVVGFLRLIRRAGISTRRIPHSQENRTDLYVTSNRRARSGRPGWEERRAGIVNVYVDPSLEVTVWPAPGTRVVNRVAMATVVVTHPGCVVEMNEGGTGQVVLGQPGNLAIYSFLQPSSAYVRYGSNQELGIKGLGADHPFVIATSNGWTQLPDGRNATGMARMIEGAGTSGTELVQVRSDTLARPRDLGPGPGSSKPNGSSLC